LIDEGYEVYCYVANIGQDEDFEAAKAKAYKVGAKEVFIVDVRKEFVVDFIFPAIQANAIYESRYLMGTSLARPCIAFHQVRLAHQVGAKYVAHGATGKGNDQVRFELSVYALDPSLEIIAPWRMEVFYNRFQGRSDLLAYAKSKGIPISSSTSSAPYSMDENLYHISYESGVLEDPANAPNDDMYLMTKDPVTAASEKPENIRVHFKKGLPVKVENLETHKSVEEPLELMLFLNDLGKKHGIGRIDIVENRFVGVKSRGVYETPGGTILREAHLDIEGVCLDREVMRLRDSLSSQFADKCYNGFWFAPEMEFIRSCIATSQKLVDGWVNLKLYKGRAYVVGRYSPYSLYNQDLSSMEIAGGFVPSDSSGFIKINSIRLKASRAVIKKVIENDPNAAKDSFVATALNALKPAENTNNNNNNNNGKKDDEPPQKKSKKN